MIGKTFIHYLAVSAGISLAQTQTSSDERNLLKKYLPGRKRIVEVGVYEGFTTRALADASDHDAVVYGVDPFFAGRLGISWGYLITRKYNRNCISNGKLKIVRTLSTEVGNRVPTQVDFVFIDADHSLSGISADWQFWSQRVTSGGIIALHDTLLKPGQPDTAVLGSHKYFDSHIRHDPYFEVIATADSLAVLRRR